MGEIEVVGDGAAERTRLSGEGSQGQRGARSCRIRLGQQRPAKGGGAQCSNAGQIAV